MSRPLRVLVVGGMMRLETFYQAAPAGIVIDVVYVDSASLETRADSADALVLVTGHISHSAAAKVRSVARRRDVPLVAATGASVSRVRAAIALAYAAARDGTHVLSGVNAPASGVALLGARLRGVG